MLSVEASQRITNFKPIKLDFGPFAGLTRIIENSENPQDIWNFQTLEDFLNSVEFLNILRYYINSNEFDDDFRDRIETYLDFDRNYYVIDKNLVYQSLDNLTEVNNILPFKDRLELLKQKDFYNFGDSLNIDYKNLSEDFNIYDYLNVNEVEKLLYKQSTFYNRVPNYQDLKDNGVINQINLDIDNRNYLSSEDILKLINDVILDRLTSNVFLTYQQIEDIYNDLQNISNILTDEEYKLLLIRNSSKLDFITEDIINSFENDPIIYPNFSDDEIKLILESEQNMIKISKNMLTPKDIENIIDQYIGKNTNNNTGTNCCEEISDMMIQQWIHDIILIN